MGGVDGEGAWMDGRPLVAWLCACMALRLHVCACTEKAFRCKGWPESLDRVRADSQHRIDIDSQYMLTGVRIIELILICNNPEGLKECTCFSQRTFIAAKALQ